MKKLETRDRIKLLAGLLIAIMGPPLGCTEPGEGDSEVTFCRYEITPPEPLQLGLGETKQASGQASGELVSNAEGEDDCPPFAELLPWLITSNNRFVRSISFEEGSESTAVTVQSKSEAEVLADLQRGQSTWATRTGVETANLEASVSEGCLDPECDVPFFVKKGLSRLDVVIDPEKAGEEAVIDPAAEAVIWFPAVLQFDSRSAESRKLCLANRGLSALQVASASISSPDFRFSRNKSRMLPLRIPRGRVACLSVESVGVESPQAAELQIRSNDPVTPVARVRLETLPGR